MGVSDFHKMVVTDLQTYYRKRKAKKIRCRSNQNCCNETFRYYMLNKSFIRISGLKSKKSYNGKIKANEHFFKTSIESKQNKL